MEPFHLQALIDADDQPVFALDKELRYTAFNKAHAAAMRAACGAEIAIGGRLADQPVAADRVAERANLERALAGERVAATRASAEAGQERWLEIRYTPVMDAAGEVVGVSVRAGDVTDGEQTMQALRQSEALYRSILEASPDAIGLIDLEGNLRTISAAGVKMFGYEREDELIGRSITGFVAPEDRERALADVARMAELGFWGPEHYAARHADGGVVFVEVRGALLPGTEGPPAGLVFTVRDVTERTAMQRELELSEAKFLTAFRTSPDSVNLNRASDGLFLDISDGFTEITGFTREDVEGKLSTDLQIWADPSERTRLVRALRADGVVHGMEMRFCRKDGSTGTGLMSARMIDVNGEPCILSITKDITERKAMEAALRESEDRFTYIFEHSPIGKSVTLLDGTLHVNQAFCRMLGYSREELEHTRWQDLTPPEDVPLAQDQFDALTSGEADEVRFAKRYLHKDGSTIWTDVAVGLRRDEHGAPLYFLVSITDITAQKEIEDSLRAALEESRRLEDERLLLRDTIEASLNEIYIFSQDTLRFRFSNDGARRNLGYSAEELEQMTPVDIKPEFTRESFAALLEPLARHELPRLLFRTVHRRADGSLYPVEVHAQLFDQRPDPVYLAVIQDITEREQAEAALAASEQKWRRILIHTPQIGVSLSREGYIVFANRHFLELTGWTEEEVLGRDWFELCIPAAIRPEVRAVFDTVIAEEAVEAFSTHENQILTKSGDTRNVSWSNVATLDGYGAIAEVTSLGIDVTERRRAEAEVRRLNAELEQRVVVRTAQLEAANRELEAFSYSVSHDLRAPLRAIDGFSAMVLEDAADKLSADDLQHLARVRAGAQRMALLIDQLLGLSRASRQEMDLEDVDLSATADEILAEIAASDPERRVETVIAPGLRAWADAALLRAILTNLLANAWKFTGKHETARIEVGAQDGDGGPTFFVRDDGAGFDAANAPRLFGAFQRMHRNDEFEGDGIGLATVQRLVTRHGGRVWVEAEVEKGATFYFTLPSRGAPG